MQPRQPSTPFNPSLSLADSGKCTLWDISCCHSGGRVGLDLTVPSAKQVLSTRNSAQYSKQCSGIETFYTAIQKGTCFMAITVVHGVLQITFQ